MSYVEWIKIIKNLDIIKDRFVWVCTITALTTLSLCQMYYEDRRLSMRTISFSNSEADYNVSKIADRDMIYRGEQDKLTAIENDPNIDKSNTPEFGAAISASDGLVEVIKKSKMNTLKLTPLKVKENWNYAEEGYKYIANVMAEFTTYLKAYVITDENIDAIRIYHATNPIAVPSMIQVGNLIVKNIDGSLYATTTLNFDMISLKPDKYPDVRLSILDYVKENGLELDIQIQPNPDLGPGPMGVKVAIGDENE